MSLSIRNNLWGYIFTFSCVCMLMSLSSVMRNWIKVLDTKKTLKPDQCYLVDGNSILMKSNSCLIFVDHCSSAILYTFYIGISKKAEQSTFHKGFEEYENDSFK